MKLYFKGHINGKYPYINTITFRTASGGLIVIDRDETDYTIETDGSFTMEWSGVYIWNGEEPDYLYYDNEDEDIFVGAIIESLDIEDDAPEGYKMTITEWNY